MSNLDSALAIFTSHYVSINSRAVKKVQRDLQNLHPTMYLLIPDGKEIWQQQVENLHPTMYLLIRCAQF